MLKWKFKNAIYMKNYTGNCSIKMWETSTQTDSTIIWKFKDQKFPRQSEKRINLVASTTRNQELKIEQL